MTAHKIFALSRNHPVGIMIYGSANFMGIPWEIVIKIYRKKIGNIEFGTLKEYAQDFLNFITNNTHLFPVSERERFLKSTIYSYFFVLKREIIEKIEQIFSENSFNEKVVNEVINEIVNSRYKIWNEAQRLLHVSTKDAESLLQKNKRLIHSLIDDVFEKLPLSKSVKQKLEKIAVSLFYKFLENIVNANFSGLVIAGFGKNDFFPSLYSYLLNGVIKDWVVYKEDRIHKITFSDSAAILPFAQSEMVSTFIEGVEPNYENFNYEYMRKILQELPEKIIESIGELTESKKRELISHVQGSSKELFKTYYQKLREYRQNNFINPILKVVEILPKADLAAMAESLINITSLKRKIPLDSETVGGPVDVAVISKGDGFIWIKRKHYFRPEFNPHYFNRIAREGN